MRTTWLLLTGALLVSAAACSADDEPAPASSPSPPQAPCAPVVSTGPLPEWARTGFSGDGSGIPHSMARGGTILGVLFGRTLNAPPAIDHSNKILWVSRLPVTSGDTLRITAQSDGTGQTVAREVAGGPGPSIIDLPSAGCWRLTLAWSGHTDTMDLTFEPGPSPSP
jgi:hypothetical protein